MKLSDFRIVRVQKWRSSAFHVQQKLFGFLWWYSLTASQGGDGTPMVLEFGSYKEARKWIRSYLTPRIPIDTILEVLPA